MSTPFLRDPKILHTCLLCPCRAFNECVCVFFRQILGFLCFVGYLGLKGPHIFADKKKEHIRKRFGRGALHTCKISGSNSQKRRGHLDFSAVKCKNHGLASWLLGFSVYSILGFKFDLYIIYWSYIRSQFFEYLRETLHQHALEHLEAVGPEKEI